MVLEYVQYIVIVVHWPGKGTVLSVSSAESLQGNCKLSESPFDRKVVERVRADLRIICKESGHGDGLPLMLLR